MATRDSTRMLPTNIQQVLFVHDTRFYKVDSNYYSQGPFPATLWKRYLACFDEVTVLARSGAIPSAADISNYALSSAPGVEFVLCRGFSGGRSVFQDYIRAKRVVAKQVAQHDAIVARLGSKLGLLAVREAVKQRKPYAIELVGSTWQALWNYGSFSGKLYAPISYFLSRRAIKNAPRVLYVTKEFLQKCYPTNALVTAACSNVELPELQPEVLVKRLARLTVPKTIVRLGLIGSLAGRRYKGVDVALKALAQLNSEEARFELRVLGGGDPTNWAEEARKLGVEANVYFEGVLPAGEAVYGWLDDIDLYIQPSYTEGLPRATIEAMSRACPIIATAVGGTPELIPDPYLFKAGDHKALAKLIDDVSDDLQQQQEMAKQNFENAKEYTLPVLEEKRRQFYSTLIE